MQTVEKVRVTFTKACYHIENIPEFYYTQSSAQMFEWCRVRYPELFQRIQTAVVNGHFEIVGGSWCEPDCHIISGESWVRQRLYGQLFFKKYFGTYATIEWVPDSFGFPSTLPQILVKSNGTRFLTGKLNANEDTVFPFSTFWWESPDGLRVLAECMIGGAQAPNRHSLLTERAQSNIPPFNYESGDCDTNSNFSEEVNPYGLHQYGKGDGGHGPTGEEVERMIFLHRKEFLTVAPAETYFSHVETEVADRSARVAG